MPKEPTSAVFTCQSCGRASSADARKGGHILPFMRKLPIDDYGKCRHCGGELWTLSVIFAESGVDGDATATEIGLAAAMGVDLGSTTTSSNRLDYADVRCDVVARLNESPRDRLRRVGELSRLKERERLTQQGGRECAACGTLFVPAAGKPWAEKGYCSKMCLVEVEGASAIARSDAHQAPAKTNTIEVRCSSGHQFDVQVSFSGMLRRCPVCGEKTRVP